MSCHTQLYIISIFKFPLNKHFKKESIIHNKDIVIFYTHAKNMKTPKGTVAAVTATSISKIYFIKD